MRGNAMPWNAVVDRLTRLALAPGAATNIAMFARGLLAPAPYPEPILDVGCGATSPLVGAGLRTVGVDIALSRARDHRPTAVVADAAALPFADGSFPAVFSLGLLHELADEAARRAIGEMMRVGRYDGRVVVFDGVQPEPGTRPLASLIGKWGRPMRTERDLRKLFDGRPTWHFQRVTYAATGLEGVWCVSRGET
jgi:SAM-dependent methyltransferase